ncbi:hypothetical protein CXX84_02650 [Arthrobacter sp. AFG7.2]|uniref:DUF1648 domain-containing protein n=1 Tax=Arthrobacter sp. AFG7.2 TaxID=1688693 RepID=UPI000C9E4A06|nr:DUF1648 domain-containing protein [Arthrobacter sp. AFG7.2]PNI10384.1 hypothetical protein CXX84_02650 [Arthrobacter sp. AFG7.2]
MKDQNRPEHSQRLRRAWFTLSLLLVLATAAYGGVLYPTMADPVPVHWNGSGVADDYAPKSVVSVFAPLMVAFATVLCLWLLHRYLPAKAGAPAAETTAGKNLLADLTPALALLFSWLSIRAWLDLEGPLTIWIPVLALMLFVLVLVFRAVSAVSGVAGRR